MDSTRPIRALMRGLDALNALNLRDGATVSEVAQEIHLPRTTAYRILETLCDSGYVSRDPADERYRLSILVRGLSMGFDDEAWITQIAKPCLFELGEAIVWPVYIATLTGTTLTVREATDHRSPLAIEPYCVGMQLPLLTTSTGLAYLADCSAAERSALLQTLELSTKDEDRLARDRDELSRLLAEVSALGYATTARTHRLLEELSISLPVALRDRPAAVLTVRFAASALPLKSGLERFLPKLRHCAAKISATFSQNRADVGTGMPRSAA
jgi:IclR family mhp operon transcriptional activator